MPKYFKAIYNSSLTRLLFYTAPCLTLKECIDNRPYEPPGYCLEDQTIPCTDDLECPVFLKGTGTCSDSISGQPRCTSNEDCPLGSTCGDILEEDTQTECWYKPGMFEEWAEGFAIDDASNQTQCENARTSLGLEANEYDDAFACEQFNEFKCDPESIFDVIDALAEEDPPRTTTTVAYNDIK